MLFSIVLLASSAVASSQQARNVRARHIARDISTGSILEKDAPAGGYKVVGDSGVSAQMMFVGTKETVYILDKAENNAMTITTNGKTHPAWGVRFDLHENKATPMEVTSNTFCAGGMPVADGNWVVFGGNKAVANGGTAVKEDPNQANPYGNTDGGKSIRTLMPCDSDKCNWVEGGDDLTMASERWYPTVEGLGDGSVIVLGGERDGGYVATKGQNEPSYEFWPKKPEGKIDMDFLDYTTPLSMYPLTWLLPSGKLFLQAAYKSILYDIDAKKETPLPDMPYAQRVYPASAAAVMLPLTPDNNYTAEVLFCGGSNADFSKSGGVAGFDVTKVKADDSCVRIRPDDDKPQYEDDDRLPEARSMGQLIYLPDGTMWLGNGVGMGTAGYGLEKYSIGLSYGQEPLYAPAIYDPKAPSGKRFTRDGLGTTKEERMYHSSAVLLADGAVLVSGGNPNPDVSFDQWPTKYSVEKWYPPWYNSPRPKPSGFPEKLSYGGPAWNLTLSDTSIDPATVKVALIRSGFSTHCMNMGQRYLELETSYSMNKDTGVLTIFASQMPPNSNIFSPGPAMIFLVVDGVPSEGEMVIVGSGAIGEQPLQERTVLPQPEVIVPPSSTDKDASGGAAPTGHDETSTSGLPVVNNAADKGKKNGASALVTPTLAILVAAMGVTVWM